MPKQQTLRFVKEKDTKNTVKFAEQPEEGQPQVIGSLYVQKWWTANAASVTVTLETE